MTERRPPRFRARARFWISSPRWNSAARLVLWEVISLADHAPVLTDEQLRFRLLALAECTALRSHAPPRSPAGRWSSEAPDSAPGGQPAPQDTVSSAP